MRAPHNTIVLAQGFNLPELVNSAVENEAIARMLGLTSESAAGPRAVKQPHQGRTPGRPAGRRFRFAYMPIRLFALESCRTRSGSSHTRGDALLSLDQVLGRLPRRYGTVPTDS